MLTPERAGDEAPTAPLISALDVSKTFSFHGRSTLALDGMTIGISKGSFVSVIGPSGCGKSTFLRIVGGLEKPTSGEVVYRAQDSIGKPRMAFVFQDGSLFPWLTVLGNVAFGLRMDGVGKLERERRARDWIRRVGLADFEAAYPSQLSGGMRQRLSLARAFVVDPDVLLMDEPMGALDAQTRSLIQEELVSLWESTRKTVILVTHSIEEGILLGDRVVVMGRRPGRIKMDLPIPLARPRSVEVTGTAGFGELKLAVWETLRDEVQASLELS